MFHERMCVNMLMMGHSLDDYYRTNAAEYGLMLIANQMANGTKRSENEPQEQEEQKFESMGAYLAARRAAKQEG